MWDAMWGSQAYFPPRFPCNRFLSNRALATPDYARNSEDCFA